jgi:NAD(P)-dependent dehydrogenase (short-subunit alcohol dehydrogenase family)
MADRVLEGKVVMMTGAGRGMGRMMSIALAEAGAKVAMIDIDEDVLKASKADVESAGGQGCALDLPCDVTNADAAAAALDQVLTQFGRVDVLVNDAVVGPERIGDHFFTEPPKYWELDDGLWRQMLEVNIFGPQLMARTVTPTMLEAGSGRIINVTTSLNTMYRAGAGAYGPSKAALEAHSRIMAHDLEGTGVCVNILIPGGPVNTRMIPVASGVDRTQLIQPEVMREPIVWLCSEDSNGINGLRFIARQWDTSLAREARIDAASAPIAWPQLGAQSIQPD